MKTRTLTSIFIVVAYAVILLLTFFVHKVFFDVFILLLMILSGLEMSKAISKKFSKPIDVFIVIDCVVGYIAFFIINTVFSGNLGIAAYFGVLALIFIACITYSMFSKKADMKNVTSTMLVLVYPVSLLIYMLGLNYFPQNVSDFNVAAILLLVLISTLTDTFAYLIGSMFKGPKLCPSISPNKTISGAIGGAVGGMLGASLVLCCSIFGWLGVPALSATVGLNITHYLILGFVGALFTQLGDLIASYAKRQCEIKDFGKLLPGHGGILDRIDGMLLNSVFLYIYLMILAV